MNYYSSDAPLREALIAITGKEPTLNLLNIKHLNELTPEDQNLLYEWCTQNRRPYWATGLGVLEAAELLVRTAIENANI